MIGVVKSRPTDPDDEPFLRELFGVQEAERLPLGVLTPDDARRVVDTQFKGHQLHYDSLDADLSDSILIVDDQPAGRLIIVQDAKEIRLADLVLIPALRGRGLGTALIEGLQVESRTSNRPLRLVTERGARVLNLYHRLGFYKIDETPTHYLLEWTYRPQR